MLRNIVTPALRAGASVSTSEAGLSFRPAKRGEIFFARGSKISTPRALCQSLPLLRNDSA